MSIRIGLYDFFAYTIPGVFYLLIAVLGLTLFGVISLDWDTINTFALHIVLLIVGMAYVAGVLMDPIAYRWLRLFYRRNTATVQIAIDRVQKHYYPWLKFDIKANEWPMLLRTIKSKSLEVGMDVEQHNVASIMLRNISLGFVLLTVLFVSYYFIVNRNWWIIVFACGSALFSIVALRRSETRRLWFYLGIFDAFIALSMPVEKWFINRIGIPDEMPNSVDPTIFEPEQ